MIVIIEMLWKNIVVSKELEKVNVCEWSIKEGKHIFEATGELGVTPWTRVQGTLKPETVQVTE